MEDQSIFPSTFHLMRKELTESRGNHENGRRTDLNSLTFANSMYRKYTSGEI